MINWVISFSVSILGYVIARIKHNRVSEVFIGIINSSLFYLAVPITIFDAVYSEKNLLFFSSLIAASIAHMVLLFILSYVIVYMLNLKNTTRILALLLSAAMPNAGFVAIPLALMVFGDTKIIIPYTIAFNILVPIIVVTLGFLSGKNENRFNSIARSMYTSIPFLISFISALVLNLMRLELSLVSTLLSIIKWYTILSFLIIGYELAKVIEKTKIRNLGVFLGIIAFARYMFSPILILAMNLIINFGNYRRGLLLQSIMPPAITNIILAKKYDLDIDIVVLSIAVFTPLSIILSLVLGMVYMFL
jgi:predicted permease